MRSLVAASLLLCACGPKLIRLEPERVRDVDVALAEGGTALCPTGEVVELRAFVRYRDGSVFESRSSMSPRGRISPRALVWSANAGAVDADGRLRLPELLAWHDREIEIGVGVPGRPDVYAARTLSPRFDCDRVADFSGTPGRAGGGRGAPGARVDVAIAYVETERNGRLVLVRATEAGGPPTYYLVDRRGPSAARLVVAARGGPGGRGIEGDDGTDGTDGSDGSAGHSGGTCQDGGDGGDGSDGGDGGDGEDGGPGGAGGDGGAIAIAFPEGSPELARALRYDVSGGEGGAGGAGGDGGDGGDGGHGGSGGSGGSSTGHDGSWCSTSSGSSGRDGSDGRSGSDGDDGPPGEPGRPGTITAHAAPVEELFASEIAAGWRIVRTTNARLTAR